MRNLSASLCNLMAQAPAASGTLVLQSFCPLSRPHVVNIIDSESQICNDIHALYELT